MRTIKQWYQSTYPEDGLGSEINPEATFIGLWHNISSVYEYTWAFDSLVRERCFEELAKRMNVPYETIYKQWVDSMTPIFIN